MTQRNNRSTILLTNDDGFFSPGLQALRTTLNDFGRIIAVAPDRERSGVSHSLTLIEPLRIEQPDPKIWGDDCYLVSGTPADCVKLALAHILPEPPSLIISGINRGANTGININYSGTVAAALEGALAGIPSIAISRSSFNLDHFHPAAVVAARIVKKVLENDLPTDTFLNVNIPFQLNGDADNFVITHQGNADWKDRFVERKDPRNYAYYWLDGINIHHRDDPLADTNVVRQGKVSITPLRIDRTAHHQLDFFRRWNNA